MIFKGILSLMKVITKYIFLNVLNGKFKYLDFLAAKRNKGDVYRRHIGYFSLDHIKVISASFTALLSKLSSNSKIANS